MATAAVALGFVALSACSAPAPAPTPSPTESLTGLLVAVGGPAGVPARPLAGTITVHRPLGPTTTLTTRRDGTFAVALPLGSYRITGRSQAFDGGQLECLTATTTIAATTTAPKKIEVICSEK